MKNLIRFVENNHQYIGDDGDTDWISVTTFIHSFTPKKDWNKIAERYAKKTKTTKEEVQKKWNNENKVAVDRGIKFHKQREADIISYQTINGLNIYRSIIDENGDKISIPQKLSDGVYPELLVYLKSAKICGQADFVEIKDGTINIRDYKTNKEIKHNGFINWEGVEEHLLDPVSDIPNSNYWLYALQLNTYAYIIKRNNPSLKIGTLELLHARFDDIEEISGIEKYQLPDLQMHVKNMINHYKNKK